MLLGAFRDFANPHSPTYHAGLFNPKFRSIPRRIAVMAENENTAAVADENEQQQEYQYEIRIEDAGPATKRVVVEIPRDRIDEKLAEQYKELRQQAAIPGFRPG